MMIETGAAGRGSLGLIAVVLVALAAGAGPARGLVEDPKEGTAAPGTSVDDRTFRPTVLVRKGLGRGSGTVIASVDDEALILTAAHVVREPGDLLIELHRYNFGFETEKRPGESWPRLVGAEVAATDADADVAVLRIRGMLALPYVARLSDGGEDLSEGARVTSLGVDRGARLGGWETRVRDVAWLELAPGSAERLFVFTDRAPELGRSGGGLFDGDGGLLGVCVGRAELSKGRWSGLFTSAESVRRLIRERGFEPAIARSEQWHVATARRARSAGRLPVATTEDRRPRDDALPRRQDDVVLPARRR